MMEIESLHGLLQPRLCTDHWLIYARVNIGTLQAKQGVCGPVEAEGFSPNIEQVESFISREVASTKLDFGHTSHVTSM